jgi:hypothetical protein
MIKNLIFGKSASRLATPQDVDAFQRHLGIILPPTFVEFCQRYNGGFPDDQNKLYLVPQSYREFHTEYPSESAGIISDGLYGISSEVKGLQLLKELNNLPDGPSSPLFPISFDLLGNYVVLKQDDLEGEVWWFDHELWDAPGIPALLPVAPDLESFYNGLTLMPRD